MPEGKFKIEWLDAGREPVCKPDPNYPNGKNMDMSQGQKNRCTVDLPYPAKRCGGYVVTCEICGYRFAVSTAGRPDDPRKITVACKVQTENA